MNTNTVGVDVSRQKNTVAILRPGGKVVSKPFDVPYPICPLVFNHLRSLSGILMVKHALSWSVSAATMNW